MTEVTESTANDHALFSDALEHFARRQHELDSALQASQRSLDAQFVLHDGHLKQCKSQWAEYTRLQAMQRDLYAGMTKEEKAAMHERLEDEEITMELAKKELDQWRQAKPGNQSSLFLRIVLGRVNYQLWKKADRVRRCAHQHPLALTALPLCSLLTAAAAVSVLCQLEFKDAYNRFKRETTIIFVIFPGTPLRAHIGVHAMKLGPALLIRFLCLPVAPVQRCSCCSRLSGCCSSCTSCGCCTTTSRSRCARTYCTPTAPP